MSFPRREFLDKIEYDLAVRTIRDIHESLETIGQHHLGIRWLNQHAFFCVLSGRANREFFRSLVLGDLYLNQY